MKAWLHILLIAAASSACTIKDELPAKRRAPITLGTPIEVPAPAKRPEVLFDDEVLKSGAKLMRPRVLGRVLQGPTATPTPPARSTTLWRATRTGCCSAVSTT